MPGPWNTVSSLNTSSFNWFSLKKFFILITMLQKLLIFNQKKFPVQTKSLTELQYAQIAGLLCKKNCTQSARTAPERQIKILI